MLHILALAVVILFTVSAQADDWLAADALAGAVLGVGVQSAPILVFPCTRSPT
jgi:hypothetical protein